ncbi:MAG: carotenoid 1,2-hydratase, partial [Hyphococcus sp.]
MRFVIDVPKDGYAWWYVDAISEDGRRGLTIIAFIGSVFSPYYAWSRSRDPFDFCAINVALYNEDRNYWAMTERGRAAIDVGPDVFRVGRSALAWDGSALRISIDETTVPLPSPLRGEVTVTPVFMNDRTFIIDADDRHRWR